MIENKKIIVVMPAYNVEKTIERSINALPHNFVDEIIVVNDGSNDNTEKIAKRLGATVFTHAENRGYGAAQKTGYSEALKRKADVIAMVHSDFQYDPTLLPEIIRPIILSKADVCFGSRMANKKSARRGGMPLWRFTANIGLTLLEETVLRLGLSEYHSGYRAFSRETLERIPFETNSDNYVFDSEMLAQLAVGHFRAAEIPIPTRYFEEAKSPNFFQSTVYGVMTLLVLVKYLLHIFHIKSFPKFILK